MLGKIEGGRRRGQKRWDGWMVSPTQWTWVWAISQSRWWTGRPGVLQSIGVAKSGTWVSDWAELNWTEQVIKGKVKEVTKYLKIKHFCKLKNDRSKNKSRNFSGAVEGSVGSVQFQRVPCSSLYFSRSIHPFQCLVNANCRVLICCTRHFRNGSFFFILPSSVGKSLQCLISALTQGGEGGHYLGSLVQLCCGEGRTLRTNIAGVYGECSVYGPHWVCPS